VPFLDNIYIKNFRNIRELKLKINSSSVCFYGDNAEGKTNILEAIYILSNLKSFRYSNLNDLVNFDEKKALVEANFINDFEFNLSYEITKDNKNYKINNNAINSIKEIYNVLRIVAYTPNSYYLLLGSENEKRLFFDKLSYSINAKHIDNLIYYNRVLKQRNILIKQNKKFNIYDELLAESGSKIVEIRNQAITEIEDDIKLNFKNYFNNINDIKIKYKSYLGNTKKEILKNLSKNIEKDKAYQCTCYGTHRDIFEIKINNINTKKIISTGQSKLLTLLFKLAKLKIIKKYTKIKPIFLFDDTSSFLDIGRFKQVVDNIKELEVQIFFSTVDKSLFTEYFFDSVKVLKVINGEVKNE